MSPLYFSVDKKKNNNSGLGICIMFYLHSQEFYVMVIIVL